MEENIFLTKPEETKEPWEGPVQTKVLPIIPLLFIHKEKKLGIAVLLVYSFCCGCCC